MTRNKKFSNSYSEGSCMWETTPVMHISGLFLWGQKLKCNYITLCWKFLMRLIAEQYHKNYEIAGRARLECQQSRCVPIEPMCDHFLQLHILSRVASVTKLKLGILNIRYSNHASSDGIFSQGYSLWIDIQLTYHQWRHLICRYSLAIYYTWHS